MTDAEVACLILLILILMLLYCYNNKKEYFGIDEKPFEPDGSMPMRNPWDDIDYVVPKFLVKY